MGEYLRRITLRRHDGAVYLDRWGIGVPWLGQVYLHRMDAPDPGKDLHDHPWAFVSIVLVGGYTEERALCREAPGLARLAEHYPESCRPGVEGWRRRFSVRLMRLDECHRITRLDGKRCWTLVFAGPKRRRWGFYLPSGYMDEREYDEKVRVHRRDLWEEGGYVESLLGDQAKLWPWQREMLRAIAVDDPNLDQPLGPRYRRET